MTQPIIATARTWVGTRFTHQGRRKATAQDAGGVDCLGLLIGVAEECGLRFDGLAASALDKRDYGHYPDEARLYTTLAKHLIEVLTAKYLYLQTGKPWPWMKLKVVA